MKTCSKCKIEKPLGNFFQRHKDGITTYISQCRLCLQKYQEEHRIKEKEQLEKYKDCPKCEKCQIILNDEVCETCKKQHGLSTKKKGECDDCFYAKYK